MRIMCIMRDSRVTNKSEAHCCWVSLQQALFAPERHVELNRLILGRDRLRSMNGGG